MMGLMREFLEDVLDGLPVPNGQVMDARRTYSTFVEYFNQQPSNEPATVG
jgi:hypothetical protein